MVTRPRTIIPSLIVMVCLVISLGAPAGAAADPAAAVRALVDRIGEGRFDELDTVVCSAEQAAVREQFDVAAQFGELPGVDASQFTDAFIIMVRDPIIDILDEDADAAVVRLRGEMASSLDPLAAEALVVSMAEVFGEDLDGADLEPLVESMLASFSDVRQLDEEVRVVRENGAWLVCDPLDRTSDGSRPIDDGTGPRISLDGLCGLLPIELIDTTGPLRFDSSSGFEDSCVYTDSDPDVFTSLSTTVDRFNGIEQFEQVYPDFEATMVAGRPVLAGDDLVYLGLADGSTLVVSVFLDGPQDADLDVRGQLLAVAELLAPVIPLREAESTAPPAVGLFDDQLPLCEALTLERLNSLGAPQYERVEGEGEFCSYVLDDPAVGFNFLTLSLTTDSSLEEFAGFLPGGEDMTVADAPAYFLEGQLFIETDRGLLGVGAFASDPQGLSIIDGPDYAIDVATEVIAGLAGLIAPADRAGTPDDGAGGSDRSLCELVSLDALNGIGPLQYDDVFDDGSGLCLYSATTPEQGSHSLSIFPETFTLAEIMEVFDGGTASVIAGRAAYGLDETLWLDLGGTVLAISPFIDDAIVDPGTDVLGIAADVAGIVLAALDAEA